MDRFLSLIDYNNIFTFLNVNEQAQKLAIKARDGTIPKISTGKELLKICLDFKLRSDNQRHIIDIDSVTDEIWNSRLSASQKWQFKNLADNVNKARNATTIELIARINTPQITKTPLENSILNGTSFHDDKGFEFLIHPFQ
ncbi:uncharacterized protein OCT59_002656 [Rhizophagus irregularis]|uniref:Uncharacterized protein n=1 Tax=Rhizophagus irregularis (strain DAOM 181602 / DAOM 197198 / MUCL 43194) TaxID=747089 RepID=U9T8N0_RHIID|nr:hypothetical protein GLOIN_2v1483316 [Rhizophagus irregularis DAOM 181602=DAOM 197198]POG65143.1 hypothetical protein GLOIN_2v1483316 [Rhizophagus irregularis DAOM 181602=DAOM 197198]UZO11082.1 hypothetical protein OCT59_002656 [Rhizophagus irregularis]GBC13712.1 hypothetical protein GLOIN_2v1483316 [Rhizophagus irregularis DAOM 181602=DAOM 197198]CAG8725051.1 13504_t:CDS:1 [Rhizophagus irregularis]|eukprot:XP_025172009.1 hypothetical protein GLOIN_2v1483316 [Rhizophagus irregularis DAOM 181602=DAOM 197198]